MRAAIGQDPAQRQVALRTRNATAERWYVDDADWDQTHRTTCRAATHRSRSGLVRLELHFGRADDQTRQVRSDRSRVTGRGPDYAEMHGQETVDGHESADPAQSSLTVLTRQDTADGCLIVLDMYRMARGHDVPRARRTLRRRGAKASLEPTWTRLHKHKRAPPCHHPRICDASRHGCGGHAAQEGRLPTYKIMNRAIAPDRGCRAS